MPKLNKKIAVGLASATIVAIGAGAAYAYWTTTGAGSGSASTGTSSAWEVTSDASVGSPLSPNGPTQTVAVHVKNNNSGVQHLNGVSVAVANSDGTAWTSVSGCSAADYAVSFTSPVATGDVASSATVSGVASIQMLNLGSNQDGCKNATVPLYFSAS